MRIGLSAKQGAPNAVSFFRPHGGALANQYGICPNHLYIAPFNDNVVMPAKQAKAFEFAVYNDGQQFCARRINLYITNAP